MKRFFSSAGLFLIACWVLGHDAVGQSVWPPNLHPDTLHAPFLHGVASGDPLADRVIIWTKATPPSGQVGSIPVQWEVATDNSFSQIVRSGQGQAGPATDHCFKVDVDGLSPGTRYWYRFRDSLGRVSTTGRTKTAAGNSSQQIRLAVASCSSIYSGFFNAYERIGQRHDLDLVVHLGDYIYDFVDPDEEIRVPSPYPAGPITLQDWRDRHAYYLLDPDLRLARSRHPWTAIWDNHDLDNATNPEPKQAFFEYLPIRRPDSNNIHQIYRKLSYGNLLDVFLLDVTTQRNIDTLTGGNYSILGDSQWTWLSNELLNSTAQWKVIGNERMVGNFSLNGLPGFIPFGDGPVADSSAWDGFTEDRDRILNFLASNSIHNTIFLSGDIHMSFACDLAPSSNAYDPQTGAGSVAVEFLPTSISRGNFDEAGFGGFLADLAQTAMAAANPHHVFEELEQHGYGVLDITAAQATGEYWYSEILNPSSNETFGNAFQCLSGQDHWDRNPVANPTVYVDESQGLFTLKVWPNPVSGDGLNWQIRVDADLEIDLELISVASGQQVWKEKKPVFSQQDFLGQIQTKNLASGLYLLRINGQNGPKIMVENNR
jgi:alkaline phosphatase D